MVRVEPTSCNQGRRKNNAYILSATLSTQSVTSLNNIILYLFYFNACTVDNFIDHSSNKANEKQLLVLVKSVSKQK